MTRYLTPHILEDLKKKMVFLAGPRQCGKTTLAKSIISMQGGTRHAAYFNWDDDRDRRALLNRQWSDKHKLLVFDEVHKFPRWKNWLKGIYDTQQDKHHILVTGSARLDLYRKGGDSLLGRYHHFRLHPFSLSEIPPNMSVKEAFQRLMEVGGFPEPFLNGDARAARRWRKERFDSIFRQDIRDLEPIKDIVTLSLLVELLKTRVGGLIVYSNLAQELQVAPQTIKRWIESLERMYLIFCVKPYHASIARAVLKPPKIYFYDNADVLENEGMRFENLIATHLLKKIQFLEDRDGYRYELRYLRDKEGREVDFVILKENKVIDLIEAKYSDASLSKHLQYYAEKLQPTRATQIVGSLQRPFQQGKLKVVSPFEALHTLEESP